MIFIDSGVRIQGITRNLLNLPMTINTQYSSDVELKGTFVPMSIFHLATNDLDLIKEGITAISSNGSLFKNVTPIVVDVQKLNEKELTLNLATLKQVMWDKKLMLIALRHANGNQQAEALELGIMPDFLIGSENAKEKDENSLSDKIQKSQESVEQEFLQQESLNKEFLPSTLLLLTKVRSGQRIYSRGDVVIIGSVSAGAEILSEGNIHIYGTLRGKACAGGLKNTDARIFCSDLQAELISIAGNYKICEDIHGAESNKLVQIYLQENTLICTPLV